MDILEQLDRLMMASEYEAFRELLSKHPSVINDTDSYKETLLHKAIAWKHRQVVKTLIDAGADVNRVTDTNHTPLFYAVCHRDEASVLALLAAGADPSINDDHGNGPLWRAIYEYKGGEGTIIRALLKCGADRNSVNKYGKTPLWLAMSIDSKELHLMFE